MVFGINGSAEDALSVCEKESAEFFLICICFTGFELLICDTSSTYVEAEAKMNALNLVHKRMLMKAFEVGGYQHINFLAFASLSQRKEFEINEGSEFYKYLRFTVRQCWLSQTKQIGLQRTEGGMH